MARIKAIRYKHSKKNTRKGKMIDKAYSDVRREQLRKRKK